MVDQNQMYQAILENLYDGVYVCDLDRRVTFWNQGAERITGYPAGEALGRHCRDNLLVHVDETGRNLCLTDCPMTATMADGNPREAEVFLQHKDGHRVAVMVRVSPLRDEQGAIVGAVEVFEDNTPRLESRQRIEELEHLAMLDALTNLPNRRYLQEQLHSRMAELERVGWPFGVLYMDLDDFKKVNDAYGHGVGDQVLQVSSRTLWLNSRPYDVVGRWGGEEFLAILPKVDLEVLDKIAQRYCGLVRRSQVRGTDKGISFTISIGGTMALKGEPQSDLLARADRLLYQSKETGKDRATVA